MRSQGVRRHDKGDPCAINGFRSAQRRVPPAVNKDPDAGREAPEQDLPELARHSLAGPVKLQLGGMSCTLRCVDDLLPRHSATRHGERPRLSYLPGEVVHFELGGHRWALVAEDADARASADGPGAGGRLHEQLTNRELQIVQFICMGLLTKQVADRLHLSEFTVRSYLKTIYAKLGVRSRGAMVYRYAQALGMPRRDEDSTK